MTQDERWLVRKGSGDILKSRKYTDARIAMMANSLHHPSFSFKIIKSDIFQNELYNDGSMCFSKLRRDMLK